VKRRDFLLFRTEGRTKTVELSCERLYMRYVDARRAPEADAADDVADGEPPPRFERPGVRQLFDDLARDLDEVDIVRVTHSEWLADGEFSREVRALVDRVRGKGGRVDMQ
jgi:hypothetical protein